MYFDFITRIAATNVARAYWGSRLFGVGIGLMANLLAEGASQAIRNLWFRRDDAPEDAVLLKGAESGLPIYPAESLANYRVRVGDRWNRLETLPVEAGITAELAAAGHDGVVVLQPGHPGPGLETDYYSQFWVSTSETSDAQLTAQRAIIQRAKPAEYIFRGFIITGFTGQLFAIGEAAVGEDPVGG
jgi:hypothetical protein